MNSIRLAKILDELLEEFTRKQMDCDKVIYLFPSWFCILILDSFFRGIKSGFLEHPLNFIPYF